MAKLYFQDDDENCYNIQHHIDYMKENEIKEMKVFEAKPEHGTGMFFCKEYSEVGEVNGTCGKMCDKYMPRNGKSGICKYHGFVFEQTDKSKIIKI